MAGSFFGFGTVFFSLTSMGILSRRLLNEREKRNQLLEKLKNEVLEAAPVPGRRQKFPEERIVRYL
jgi:hypothetical protein